MFKKVVNLSLINYKNSENKMCFFNKTTITTATTWNTPATITMRKYNEYKKPLILREETHSLHVSWEIFILPWLRHFCTVTYLMHI